MKMPNRKHAFVWMFAMSGCFFAGAHACCAESKQVDIYALKGTATDVVKGGNGTCVDPGTSLTGEVLAPPPGPEQNTLVVIKVAGKLAIVYKIPRSVPLVGPAGAAISGKLAYILPSTDAEHDGDFTLTLHPAGEAASSLTLTTSTGSQGGDPQTGTCETTYDLTLTKGVAPAHPTPTTKG